MTAKKRTNARRSTSPASRGNPVVAIKKVTTEIRDLIESARTHVSVTANLAMVSLYWNIGRVITQNIQEYEKRAGYGQQLLERLSDLLTQEYGPGYSKVNLQEMRRFSLAFEIREPLTNEFGQVLPASPAVPTPRLIIDFRKHFRVGWTHYRMLLSISDPMQRRFYFEQAASQRWSKRELRRQIDRALFERVVLSRDTAQLVSQEEQMGSTEIARYEDIFKDPYVLDFLGLKGAYSEKDLEAAIVRNLEQFLTELGNEPVGLILCTSARRQHVELLLRHGPHKMKVAEYLTHLPDRRLLEGRLKMYSKLLKDRDHERAE